MLSYFIKYIDGSYKILDGNSGRTVAYFMNEIDAHLYLKNLLNVAQEKLVPTSLQQPIVVTPVSQQQIPTVTATAPVQVLTGSSVVPQLNGYKSIELQNPGTTMAGTPISGTYVQERVLNNQHHAQEQYSNQSSGSQQHAQEQYSNQNANNQHHAQEQYSNQSYGSQPSYDSGQTLGNVNNNSTNTSNDPFAANNGNDPFATNNANDPFATNNANDPFATNNANDPFATNNANDPFATNNANDPFATNNANDPFATNNANDPFATNNANDPFAANTGNDPFLMSEQDFGEHTNSKKKQKIVDSNLDYIDENLNEFNVKKNLRSKSKSGSSNKNETDDFSISNKSNVSKKDELKYIDDDFDENYDASLNSYKTNSTNKESSFNKESGDKVLFDNNQDIFESSFKNSTDSKNSFADSDANMNNRKSFEENGSAESRKEISDLNERNENKLQSKDNLNRQENMNNKEVKQKPIRQLTDMEKFNQYDDNLEDLANVGQNKTVTAQNDNAVNDTFKNEPAQGQFNNNLDQIADDNNADKNSNQKAKENQDHGNAFNKDQGEKTYADNRKATSNDNENQQMPNDTDFNKNESNEFGDQDFNNGDNENIKSSRYAKDVEYGENNFDDDLSGVVIKKGSGYSGSFIDPSLGETSGFAKKEIVQDLNGNEKNEKEIDKVIDEIYYKKKAARAARFDRAKNENMRDKFTFKDRAEEVKYSKPSPKAIYDDLSVNDAISENVANYNNSEYNIEGEQSTNNVSGNTFTDDIIVPESIKLGKSRFSPMLDDYGHAEPADYYDSKSYVEHLVNSNNIKATITSDVIDLGPVEEEDEIFSTPRQDADIEEDFVNFEALDDKKRKKIAKENNKKIKKRQKMGL